MAGSAPMRLLAMAAVLTPFAAALTPPSAELVGVSAAANGVSTAAIASKRMGADPAIL